MSDVVSICALIVAAIALYFSIQDHRIAREHNRRSVRPLPYVSPANFENRLRVTLRNDGVGPLVLLAVVASNVEKEQSGHLIDVVSDPPPNIYFTNYFNVVGKRAVLPGDSLELLDLGIDLNDDDAVRYRDQVRKELGGTVVVVTYTDIYEQSFEPYMKDLTWFIRELRK